MVLGRPARRFAVGWGALGAVLASLLAGCAAASSARPAQHDLTTTSSTAAPPPASAGDLSAYAGVYRSSDGGTWLLTRSGLLVDTTTDAVHAISVASPGEIDVGPSFGNETPAVGTLRFPGWHAGRTPATMLLELGSGPAVVARRLPTVAEDVRIRSGGVELAATFTRPVAAGAARLPAIAIVHGSGPETRSELDLWTELYLSLGFAVLAYDKRGVGQSTGYYPGDYASTTQLQLLAGDAAAVVAYLRTRPDVDPRRVALYGGSQGGWVLPLADRLAHPAFNIIASGPPITVGQQGVYEDLNGGGQSLPGLTTAQVDRQLAAESSGYDPSPVLANDTVPTLWLFGGADRHVPARFSVAALVRLHRPNFIWRVFPGCSHNLLYSGSGLDPADDAATHFGAGLFAAITGFVRAEGVRPS